MTQAKSKPKPRTFLEYLNYEDGTDNRYEVFEEKLVRVEPETELNDFIAECLKIKLQAFFGMRRVKVHTLQLETPQLPGMPLNRWPDLVVLQTTHLDLIRQLGKMAIARHMPPPLLVMEVVSPYSSGLDPNFSRDYMDKPQQYAMLGIPEYWIIDPQQEQVEISWSPHQERRCYLQQKTFYADARIQSSLPELEEFNATAQQVLNPLEGVS